MDYKYVPPASDTPMTAGDPCPTCGDPLLVKGAQFYWKSKPYSGLVCDNNACTGEVYANALDNILAVA